MEWAVVVVGGREARRKAAAELRVGAGGEQRERQSGHGRANPQGGTGHLPGA